MLVCAGVLSESISAVQARRMRKADLRLDQHMIGTSYRHVVPPEHEILQTP